MAELLAATYCILALGHQENIEEQETIVLVDDHEGFKWRTQVPHKCSRQ
jgi:hypothetical protein